MVRPPRLYPSLRFLRYFSVCTLTKSSRYRSQQRGCLTEFSAGARLARNQKTSRRSSMFYGQACGSLHSSGLHNDIAKSQNSQTMGISMDTTVLTLERANVPAFNLAKYFLMTYFVGLLWDVAHYTALEFKRYLSLYYTDRFYVSRWGRSRNHLFSGSTSELIFSAIRRRFQDEDRTGASRNPSDHELSVSDGDQPSVPEIAARLESIPDRSELSPAREHAVNGTFGRCHILRSRARSNGRVGSTTSSARISRRPSTEGTPDKSPSLTWRRVGFELCILFII